MKPGVRKLQEGMARRLANGDPDGEWTVFSDLAAATLSPWEEFLALWFWRLSTERPASEGGVRGVPWSKVEDRIERLGLSPAEALDFGELIERMDHEYVSFWAEEFRKTMNRKPKDGEGEA